MPLYPLELFLMFSGGAEKTSYMKWVKCTTMVTVFALTYSTLITDHSEKIIEKSHLRV